MKVLNSDTVSVCANGLRGPDWKEKELEKDVEKEVEKAGANVIKRFTSVIYESS